VTRQTHTTIYAIVDAETEADALCAARAAFDRLTGVSYHALKGVAFSVDSRSNR